jgi:prevent-host-death family protein
MLRVSASEFAKNFGRYREAAQREPVAVTSHDRITAVLISAREHEEYQKLKRMATRALYADELSDESLRALESASMDPRHAHLDALMDGE